MHMKDDFSKPGFLNLSIHILICAQSCPTLCDPMDCSPWGPSVHGDSPGKNTGVGCHALLQVIFPTQGLNPGLLHCRWIFTIWATRWKVVAEWLDAGFLASGGDEFNPGPETRLDRSELLCNKVLLKYKGDRESFWHKHQKGAKEYPPPSH